ncbi:shikimate dehydrogenase, partial [Cytophagia bacterium CHB2]|nr:shikimate dehydrogenase [Cytophagia bacterium CHB2]
MSVREKASSPVQRLAVIGDPISHSLSPLMQNFLIAHFDLPFQYEALRVSVNELPAVIARLRRGEFAGVNVTIPHKQAIIPLLDDLEEGAQRMGAVNTVISSNGVLLGHNTDVIGFQRTLESAGINVAQEEVLVLGAGGAAAAVLFSLLEMGAGMIYISNRDRVRAERLRKTFSEEDQERV